MLSFIRSKKIDQLIESRRERLYRLALSWCHDSMLADDLVQDTLNKALQKQDQIKDLEKLNAWMFRILHNTWMEHLRRYKPTTDLDDIDPLDEQTPERKLSDEQLVKLVHQAVSKLPMPQRQVVTLVNLEESSYAEVAEILDIPIGTVMSRLSRARLALKQSLIGLRKGSQQEPRSRQTDYLRRVK